MLNFFKKDFLVGMGAGFIISGIMIAFFGIGQPTDEEIRARAVELGMVQQSGGKQEQSHTNASADTSGLDRTPVSNNTTISGSTPVSNTKTVSDNTPVSNQNTVSESAKKPVNVIVEIKPGMGSETVARILEEKGVVKDQDDFYRLVTAKKAHSRFKVGKFSVPVGGDMGDILNTLTGK